MPESNEQLWRSLIVDVPDFPQPGILFRDVTPLLESGDGLRSAVDALSGAFTNIDVVAGIESRGFIFGAPVAYALGVGMVPVRKPGKLPRATVSADYSLEYGTNSLQLHRDAVSPGQRVLIVDDVLATGGTAAATVALIEELGAEVAGVAVLIELSALNGRAKLGDVPLESLISY